jgi:nucleotide-binding universal stress UspA family protein
MKLTIERILVPIDFSDHSRAVLRVAESMARSERAEMILAHVVEPVQPIATTAPYPHVETAMVEANRDKLHSISPSDPSTSFKHCLKQGSAGKGIVEIAEEERVDLIVMGTHGRRGLSRLLMGSVAEEVVRHAPCPVLTLKQPQEVLAAMEDSSADHSQSEAGEVCEGTCDEKSKEQGHESLQNYVG